MIIATITMTNQRCQQWWWWYCGTGCLKVGARGVIWVASPFHYNLPFHGNDHDGDGDGDDDGDEGYEDYDDNGDVLPIGWNWPGTLPLVASLSETRVTEPPWVMFVTNLVMLMMRMVMRRKMMMVMKMLIILMSD